MTTSASAREGHLMSNSRSVAAVTATLHALLDQGTRDNPTGTVVTTRPPDKARSTITSNQLNVFLYHTALDAAWRNMDMPGQVRPNETGVPPLPLNLYYLLTAYGENDEDALGHWVLGRAMSIMHDHPVLSGDDIRRSLPAGDLANFDLQFQAEGVRITFQPLSLSEMYNLWTTFQTQYRISAAYEVSVVLIDSNRPIRAPLPVLRRGDLDRGPVAQPGLTPPFPTLTQLAAEDPRFSPQPGDEVRLSGFHLAGDKVEVLFRHPALLAPLSLDPLPGATDRDLTVKIPDDASADDWAAGIYSVSVAVSTTTAMGADERMTNEHPMSLGPRVEAIAPNPVTRDATGAVTLTLTLLPPFRPGQRAALLIDDRYVPPRVPPGGLVKAGTLDFVVPGLVPGAYPLRLRMDGTDSIPVDRTASPPSFADSQEVTVR
jgi:hypothetical protein